MISFARRSDWGWSAVTLSLWWLKRRHLFCSYGNTDRCHSILSLRFVNALDIRSQFVQFMVVFDVAWARILWVRHCHSLYSLQDEALAWVLHKVSMSVLEIFSWDLLVCNKRWVLLAVKSFVLNWSLFKSLEALLPQVGQIPWTVPTSREIGSMVYLAILNPVWILSGVKFYLMVHLVDLTVHLLNELI